MRRITIQPAIYYITAAIIGGIGVFLIAAPVFPEWQYHVESHVPRATRKVVPIESHRENRLIIPRIGVSSPIREGTSIAVLDVQEGVLREHNTGIPGRKENVVIAGHRFQYLPPNRTTFYHLDKLHTGDEMMVYWEGDIFTYIIEDIFTVDPTQVDIRDQHEKDQLTLYTCTPLGSMAQRLVVRGSLKE